MTPTIIGSSTYVSTGAFSLSLSLSLSSVLYVQYCTVGEVYYE